MLYNVHTSLNLPLCVFLNLSGCLSSVDLSVKALAEVHGSVFETRLNVVDVRWRWKTCDLRMLFPVSGPTALVRDAMYEYSDWCALGPLKKTFTSDKCTNKWVLNVLKDFVYELSVRLYLEFANVMSAMNPHSRPGDYDLSAITTWNLCGRYFPLTAMLICPMIMIFCIEFFSDYNLTMSKICRW